jgi:hypothetical protein
VSDEGGWLPDPLPFDGDWFRYVEVLHRIYLDDFVSNTAFWRRKRVGVRYEPTTSGKAYTFWHIICGVDQATGELKDPDMDRCARLAWVKPVIEADAAEVRTWVQERGKDRNLAIALPDFSFIVFLAERREYVVLLTAYCVTSPRQRGRYQLQYEASKKR